MSLRKILLADADRDSRELLRNYLEALRYPAPIVADDGEEALRKALLEKPDLVILEVRLPKIDGFQIVAHLRSNPLTRNVQILAITALALPGYGEKCLAKGFNAYLAKPFTFQEFRELLQVIVPSAST